MYQRNRRSTRPIHSSSALLTASGRRKLERIPDDSGGTIGYEVRPLYLPWEFGKSDIMLISYSLRDGKARVYIKLDPDVERAIGASGGSGRSSRDGR